MVNHWLMKSEPDVYPYEQLETEGSTHWDGVRNYQARNMMRDDMKIGDLVLYYHSNFKPPHVAGVARVCKEGYPDHTSWDSSSKYHDPKSTPENPRWFMVDLEPVCALKTTVPLQAVRDNPACENMLLIRRGQRLSIQPVELQDFDTILSMGGLSRSDL
ncbi:EVE domain-containing protein [Candidatus Poseidoniaceae archaeon]|jgi:predicted RNA-binding protein with PUA-like domain|nr:EVE domain-containing protein [Euryarchaeota archaeon]MDA9117284.1 EVE domain-containing protein [Candidatus Poseidoniaceae archaeon]MDB9834588.1 EVE domain-containing protein [Candidatus Poseidoniaceae archaeon]|tara:strand:- start:3612 stop:4088 length:477 start_codon:yes stop_codon:yes gene_type:complete